MIRYPMAFSKRREERLAAKAAKAAAPSDALDQLASETLASETLASQTLASQTHTEDPLEALLDEQSDSEFGDLILRDAARKRAGQSVKLAEWTAQDFSSIYVRFRPHLERHARRFLNNPSQVDEVVQDAFLYLMVSLPELDSEIGVLRFLKWKTRLLALDVIRASGRAYINSIDDVPEPESAEPEVSSYLEQQDDAAVVRLALSKLNPRHREVLIASMYEEKSTEQIAAQVGLSENATRQLIFRARSAFKKALIGDVDTTGMSAGAILSVAARKAAQESKKIGASAMALIALVVLSLTVFPGLNRTPADQLAGNQETPSNQSELEVAPKPENGVVDDTAGSGASGSDDGSGNGATGDGSSSATDTGNGTASTSGDGSSPNSSGSSGPGTTASPTPTPAASPNESPFSESNLRSIFDSRTTSSLFVLDEKLVVFADNGVSASFVFNPTASEPFKEVFAEFEIGSAFFAAYPDSSTWLKATNAAETELFVYEGTLNYVFDEKGKVWSRSALAKGTLRIEVYIPKGSSSASEVRLTIVEAKNPN
jgi:RNA polymerase sigma factor (sigma-70 family)